MSRIRTLRRRAVTALGMAISALAGAPVACTGTLELSCQASTTPSNTCCYNSPGGLLLQTQFWDYDPSIGPSDSWGIHGLWPDKCDGSYVEECDTSREYKNITAILTAAGDTSLLDYMKTYWQSNDESDESFWEHEWAEHGTCVSTLDPSCFVDYQPTEEIPYFFNRTVNLFKGLPTYDWLKSAGITPSSSTKYKLSAVQSALSAQHGEEVYIDCVNGALSAVYYYFNVEGSVADGTFVAAAPSETGSCPSTVSYPPKSSSSDSSEDGSDSSQDGSDSGDESPWWNWS